MSKKIYPISVSKKYWHCFLYSFVSEKTCEFLEHCTEKKFFMYIQRARAPNGECVLWLFRTHWQTVICTWSLPFELTLFYRSLLSWY